MAAGNSDGSAPRATLHRRQDLRDRRRRQRVDLRPRIVVTQRHGCTVWRQRLEGGTWSGFQFNRTVGATVRAWA